MYGEVENRQVCCLLLPGYLLPVVRRRIVDHGSLGNYLFFLIGKYRYILAGDRLPTEIRPKTVYQNAGLELVKLTFRAETSSWLELKAVARAMNVSASYLFALLVKMDMDPAGEGAGDVRVHTKIAKYKLLLTITPANNTMRQQKKIYRLRI